MVGFSSCRLKGQSLNKGTAGSSYLPGLVMIISVPISWKDFQRSESSRVILTLLWRNESEPEAAVEGGGMPKFVFISGVAGRGEEKGDNLFYLKLK